MVAVAVAHQYKSARVLLKTLFALACNIFVARASTIRRFESQSNNTRVLYKLRQTNFRYPSRTTSPTARAANEI